MTPRRPAGLKQYELGEDLVVHHDQRSTAVCLNVSARAVWELCDGRRTLPGIASELAARTATPVATLHDDVEAAVIQLVSEGILVLPDHSTAPIGSFELDVLFLECDGEQIAIRSDSPEVLEEVRLCLDMIVRPAAGEPSRTLDVVRGGGSYLFLHDGEIASSDATPYQGLECLRSEVVRSFMDTRPDLTWFHAGAAARDGDGMAVLVSGTNGRGKSAVVTALCKQGWHYLSDEVIPIDRASQRAIPFPITPMTREATSDELPEHRLQELERYPFEVPDDQVCRRPVEIGALVFPRFVPDSPDRLRRCPPLVAASELLQSCRSLKHQGAVAVSLVVELVKRLPAYYLSYHRGSSAGDLVEQLARSRE